MVTSHPVALSGCPPACPPPAAPSVPIVGIGASAGGLEALETFYTHMPPDSGIVFIVVTHMDPHAVSYLPELLSRATHMPVRKAIDGQAVAEKSLQMCPRNVCNGTSCMKMEHTVSVKSCEIW
jgi:two-component system, chemotaxis family, CheB/CheR fusion protein